MDIDLNKVLDIGADVKYLNENARWAKAKVYGVRKVDVNKKSKVLCYLIDTGKSTDKDRPDLVDIPASDLKLV